MFNSSGGGVAGTFAAAAQPHFDVHAANLFAPWIAGQVLPSDFGGRTGHQGKGISTPARQMKQKPNGTSTNGTNGQQRRQLSQTKSIPISSSSGGLPGGNHQLQGRSAQFQTGQNFSQQQQSQDADGTTVSGSSPSDSTNSPSPDFEVTQKRDPKLGQNADEDERRATEEGRKVFVGNLKRPITRQEVVDHFSKFGEVERVILNSGFGLVLMATRDGALKATEQRWQALDWRNVEVFVYTKGAKGASWNRPYAVPPKPGPCALCAQESAEHCSLCTSALCLNEKTTCTVCCRTCQRSFCRGERDCGMKDGLDACDSCGALSCLFCALRLDATCGQCGRQFSDRIQAQARQRAERLVNARIGENDGSVYALVCLLKGDVESSREGQLVAAIDRASKLFDPKASSWCMLTALRAIKELDDAWEATRRVHNLRALRRSSKQWSTDLGALIGPPGSTSAPPMPVSNQRHQNNHNHHQQHQQHHQISQPKAFLPSPYPSGVSSSFAQQQQYLSMTTSNGTPSAALSNTVVQSMSKGEDMMIAALRATETFLMDLDSKPKTETDWLVSNLRNVALSVTKKRTVFLEELCMRMEVWAFLLRRIPSGSVQQSYLSMNWTPVNALKRAVVELDIFLISCKSREEFLVKKDGMLAECLRAARELKRTGMAAAGADLLLKRAGRSMRNCEMRALLVAQNVMPFDGCLHHLRYRRCSLLTHAGSIATQCPYSHHVTSNLQISDIDQREFDAADYEFSNEPDELSFAVSATIARQVSAPVIPQQQNVGNWNSATTNGPPPGLANNSEKMPSLSWGFLSPSPQAMGDMSSMRRQERVVDWNSKPERISAYDAGNDFPLGMAFPTSSDWGMESEAPMELLMQVNSASSSMTHTELAVQVASLCEELNIVDAHTQLTAAFLASGAAHHECIWDTDVVKLHKELLKISGLPASVRVRIINLVTERRRVLAPLPSIASMMVPPLL